MLNKQISSKLETINLITLADVTGGFGVTPETVGCAVGGAVGARVAGNWGAAEGCVIGGAVANELANPTGTRPGSFRAR